MRSPTSTLSRKLLILQGLKGKRRAATLETSDLTQTGGGRAGRPRRRDSSPRGLALSSPAAPPTRLASVGQSRNFIVGRSAVKRSANFDSEPFCQRAW